MDKRKYKIGVLIVVVLLLLLLIGTVIKYKPVDTIVFSDGTINEVSVTPIVTKSITEPSITATPKPTEAVTVSVTPRPTIALPTITPRPDVDVEVNTNDNNNQVTVPDGIKQKEDVYIGYISWAKGVLHQEDLDSLRWVAEKLYQKKIGSDIEFYWPTVEYLSKYKVEATYYVDKGKLYLNVVTDESPVRYITVGLMYDTNVIKLVEEVE